MKRFRVVFVVLAGLAFVLTGCNQQRGIVALAAGKQFSCALQDDGTVTCWGLNDHGQLGNGTTTSSSYPVAVTGITTATAVTVGAAHACAVLDSGSVRCWGSNGGRQLGDGTTFGRLTPVAVLGLTNATAIDAGWSHTCALLGDGTATCWGNNTFGQLGNGSTNHSASPVPVAELASATSITAGERHTCALVVDGSARCWGANSYGQLGDGTTTQRLTPVPVTGITNATVVAASDGSTFEHTCAVFAEGTARCWGWNSFGQLGDGTQTARSTPVTVLGISTATSVTAGALHSCALLADGTARCWGRSVNGELGDGSVGTWSLTAVQASDLADATTISGGFQHTCARLADGTAKCWGLNSKGELGDGTTTNSPTPVYVRKAPDPEPEA